MAAAPNYDGRWLPVESNPEMLNAYAAKLGLDTSAARFADVLSTEAWALDMLPRPVHALIVLFPIKPASEAFRAAEEAARAASPAPHASTFFVTQTIPNACGTIALVHALANSCAQAGGALALPEDSWLGRFVAAQQGASPAARAAALEADAALEAFHSGAVQQGQSAVVDDTHQHFFCLVERGGRLVELDGRKAAPIVHGPTTADTLLEDAAAFVRAVMERDPGELRFSLIALARTAPEEE